MSTGRSLLLLSVLALFGGFCLVCLGEPATAEQGITPRAAVVPSAALSPETFAREAIADVAAVRRVETSEPLAESDTDEPVVSVEGAATIEGLVRNAGGELVEGGHVWVFAEHTVAEDDQTEARSDEQGNYVLTIASAPLRRVFVACQVDHLQAAIAGPFDVLRGDRRRVAFTLAEPVTMRGIVLDVGSDRPVANAMVQLRSQHRGFGDGLATTSAADGSFTLTNAGLPERGVLLQVVGDATHGPATLVLDTLEPRVVVHVGGLIQVEGTVIDAISQQPLFNVAVRLVSSDDAATDDHVGDEAFTARDGHFTINLRNVSFEDALLVVTAPDHEPLRVDLADVSRPVRGRELLRETRIQLRPVNR